VHLAFTEEQEELRSAIRSVLVKECPASLPRSIVEGTMAKAATGDCQRFVAAEGIQLLGGIAYTWEQDQHLWIKRAMTGDLLFGRVREQRARSAALLAPDG
jgi:alkylation response protein AidB-like acyl-CoA dehydrogenase